ncbi:MAG: sigma-E factor negative regulatory protein [Comamonas sp.]
MKFDNQSSNKASAMSVEQLSVLMDGELAADELQSLLGALPDLDRDMDCYATVQSYMAIGDVLRASHGVHSVQVSGVAFLNTLNAKLAQEPPLATQVQPSVGEVQVPQVQVAAPVDRRPEAANQSVFRWKLVAGFASIAAVAMVGWNSMALLGGNAPAPNAGQQVASAGAVARTAPTSAQGLVQMPVTVGQNATVMLRDPRLDELLAARGQIGGTANLQMPASFLRNATFNAEKQTGGCPDKASRLC